MTRKANTAGTSVILRIAVVTHVRHYWDMSTQSNETRIPVLTLGWRLQMALGEGSAQAMADSLGVSRATISRWMHDKGAPPKRAYIMQWALITGVPVEWLTDGGSSSSPTPPDGGGEPVKPSDAVAKLAASKRNSTHRRTTGRYLTPAVAA